MNCKIDIERSIIKKYRKEIWSRFVKAVKEYKLIDKNDRIAVAISGGKDSLLLAKCIQEIQRHGQVPFESEFIVMDPGYQPEIRNLVEETCKGMEIPAEIYDSDVFEIAELLDAENPCYLCARMRRGSLYAKAEELGCNKLALGHHFDDIIETILMNVLFSANYRTMMPKLHSTNFDQMELIRPMSYIRESDIIAWMEYNDIPAIDCACTVTSKQEGTARTYVKTLIQEIKKDYPMVESSIYRSAEQVELGAVLGFKDFKNRRHSFLDYYEMRGVDR